MGIDIHRPLTLRLLNDVSGPDEVGVTIEELARTLMVIGTWTTRLWLSDRPTAGMNRAVAELAHEPGPDNEEDFAAYWLDRIRRLRNSRVGVPNDEEVQEGIRNRKAYGGTATRSSFAVLCALMEAEHREEAPARDHLTIEHVMPQTLTQDWKQALGATAEETHGKYRDRLANLTLSGDVTNSAMGADTFDAKRRVYETSSIGMTRRLADEDEWEEAAIERRAEDLARRALDRWPWHDQTAPSSEAHIHSASLRWRIGDGSWHQETGASQMVLNIAGALLSLNPANAEKLSGEAISSNLHLASRYAPGSTVGSLTVRSVPGHDEYVMYPYGQDYPASVERCRKMGERCGVRIDVEHEEKNRTQVFWKLFKEHTGGVPGQKETWRGASQWTDPINSWGDRIGMYVGNPELLWLYIRSGESRVSDERTARMRRYSRMIRAQMSDQVVAGNLDKDSRNGTSVVVQRRWTRDDEDAWPEVAEWLIEQYERLRVVLIDPAGPIMA